MARYFETQQMTLSLSIAPYRHHRRALPTEQVRGIQSRIKSIANAINELSTYLEVQKIPPIVVSATTCGHMDKTEAILDEIAEQHEAANPVL